MRRLIYDGDSVYEVDAECLKKKEELERKKEMEWQQKRKDINKTGKKNSEKRRKRSI